MDAAKVGMRIQEARIAHNLTQAVVAQKADIATKYLSNVECGVRLPRLETLVAIANAIGVDANSLLVDVLDVSTSIRASQLQEKISKLSPENQKTALRVMETLVDELSNQPQH